MKVLFVLTQPFDPTGGGVQRSTSKIGSFLSSKGIEVTIFSFSNSGHQNPKYAEFHHAPNKGKQYNEDNLVYFAGWLKNQKFNFVINQMPYEHDISKVLVKIRENQNFKLLGCLRNTLFSVKLNLSTYVKDLFPAQFQPLVNNPIGRAAALQLHKKRHAKDLKQIMDFYDHFVLFGSPNKQEIEYFIGRYKQQKLLYIPNSIPTVLNSLPSKQNTILWLSRLSYGQKRADLILPFWKSVMHKLPDWNFEVVGDGDAFQDIKSEIEKEKIPRITLHGKQKPDEFYSKAKIYIMTSAFEGFPNTLIEAQSFGAVPVAFNNYPMLEWIVEGEKSGILVKPFNVQEMGEKVVSLANSVSHLNELGNASLDNARKFTINKVGEEWIKVLSEIN